MQRRLGALTVLALSGGCLVSFEDYPVDDATDASATGGSSGVGATGGLGATGGAGSGGLAGAGAAGGTAGAGGSATTDGGSGAAGADGGELDCCASAPVPTNICPGTLIDLNGVSMKGELCGDTSSLTNKFATTCIDGADALYQVNAPANGTLSVTLTLCTGSGSVSQLTDCTGGAIICTDAPGALAFSVQKGIVNLAVDATGGARFKLSVDFQ